MPGDFLGFFGFSFPLLGECLALLLGESAAGHLGSVGKGVGPQQCFFFLSGLGFGGTRLGFLGL